jgi:CheY-like chemotaxis protein
MKPNGAAEGKLLNGWKEIAQYLGRGIRTVQRWEIDLQLPIRRPRGRTRSAVTALTTDIDRWLAMTPTHDEMEMPCPQDTAPRLRVLVVEDNVRDLTSCVEILKKLGVGEIDAASNVAAALLRLQDVNDGKLPPPDLIILDLNFPADSGFEVLRYRKMYPRLRSTPIIVWTALSENERQLCDIFEVRRVVPKHAGPRELEYALRASAFAAA